MEDLRLFTFISLMSYPSTIIFPYSNLTRRTIADKKELFPAPVLPTTIAFVPASIVTLSPLSAGFASFLYLSQAFSNRIFPDVSQFSGTIKFSSMPSSSGINVSFDCNELRTFKSMRYELQYFKFIRCNSSRTDYSLFTFMNWVILNKAFCLGRLTFFI